jgi:hypothetical protein
MDLYLEKWYDEDFPVAAAVSFDPALMAAMNWPWPVIVFSAPKVVASGMTPPDRIPT